MNRISKCIYFQNKSMLKSTLIFIFYYTIVCLGMFLLPVIFSELKVGGTSFNSGFNMGASVFAFIYVIASYKEMFNYLLLFGNTRRTIFLSSIVTNIALSIILAVVSAISPYVESTITKLFGYNNTNVKLLNFIYPDSNWASELLFVTALIILLTSFSMLYGALSYKLGKIFIIVFWVAFGVSFIAFPILAAMYDLTIILNAIELFFCLGVPNGILLAPINFILLSLIFNALAYLLSRRQPQVE